MYIHMRTYVYRLVSNGSNKSAWKKGQKLFRYFFGETFSVRKYLTGPLEFCAHRTFMLQFDCCCFSIVCYGHVFLRSYSLYFPY